MTYSTLMVHAEIGDAARSRLELARELANRFSALLIGFAAENIHPVMADPMGGAMGGPASFALSIEPEQQRITERLRRAEAQFRQTVGGNSEGRYAWRAFIETPLDALTREARAADLLILGREADAPGTDPLQFPDAGAVLLKAGRPILLVPPQIHTVSARRAIMAWKDTRESRRALVDALPFLTRAEEVLILEIREGGVSHAGIELRLGDVAAHLARHGVRARWEARDQRQPTILDELVLAAEQVGSDLIVAGGYSHGRLREWAFGGVTQDLLRRSPKCCLLSH